MTLPETIKQILVESFNKCLPKNSDVFLRTKDEMLENGWFDCEEDYILQNTDDCNYNIPFDLNKLAAILSEKLGEQSDNYPDELVERIKWAAAQPGKQYTSEEYDERLEHFRKLAEYVKSSNKPDNEG